MIYCFSLNYNTEGEPEVTKSNMY